MIVCKDQAELSGARQQYPDEPILVEEAGKLYFPGMENPVLLSPNRRQVIVANAPHYTP